jgi:dihydroflavonol-4-reductase
MRIGILGATGMLGHHAALAAQAGGHDVVVLHRANSRLDYLRGLRYQGRIADLDDAKSLQHALRGLDGVINAAAYYPTTPRPWREEISRACTQMEAFYAACGEAQVGRIVYVGGSIALPRRADGGPGDEQLDYPGSPEDRNPYLQVKWALDRQARDFAAQGLPVSVGIPSMSFGEHDHGPSTGRFIVEIANRTMAAFVPGQRNAVYAGDAGRGLMQVLERGKPGERYLLTGGNVSMSDLVQLIADLAGVPPPRSVPLKVARAAGQLQELRYHLLGGDAPKLSATVIALMALGQFLDGRKATRELGYRPQLSVPEAIQRAITWFRQEGMIR